eukprot:TRINITY_DN2803_c1_g1_i1.p1 TRINITY_DN2803_c1_g1~~TRINITY_DN2803_c1_g1_i1.p1  ORF type:complete len:530 (+),score=149.71 TRINITY_DN2803_c1_g1_i1:58-1647(+)
MGDERIIDQFLEMYPNLDPVIVSHVCSEMGTDTFKIQDKLQEFCGNSDTVSRFHAERPQLTRQEFDRTEREMRERRMREVEQAGRVPSAPPAPAPAPVPAYQPPPSLLEPQHRNQNTTQNDLLARAQQFQQQQQEQQRQQQQHLQRQQQHQQQQQQHQHQHQHQQPQRLPPIEPEEVCNSTFEVLSTPSPLRLLFRSNGTVSSSKHLDHGAWQLHSSSLTWDTGNAKWTFQYEGNGIFGRIDPLTDPQVKLRLLYEIPKGKCPYQSKSKQKDKKSGGWMSWLLGGGQSPSVSPSQSPLPGEQILQPVEPVAPPIRENESEPPVRKSEPSSSGSSQIQRPSPPPSPSPPSPQQQHQQQQHHQQQQQQQAQQQQQQQQQPQQPQRPKVRTQTPSTTDSAAADDSDTEDKELMELFEKPAAKPANFESLLGQFMDEKEVVDQPKPSDSPSVQMPKTDFDELLGQYLFKDSGSRSATPPASKEGEKTVSPTAVFNDPVVAPPPEQKPAASQPTRSEEPKKKANFDDLLNSFMK